MKTEQIEVEDRVTLFLCDREDGTSTITMRLRTDGLSDDEKRAFTRHWQSQFSLVKDRLFEKHPQLRPRLS